MKFAPIIDPSVRKPSPKPVRVDLRKVFTFGTALWAIALVICMILLAFGINVERLQTMCAAGTVIGVLMGIMAALNKNKWPDYLVMFIAILGTTVPVFVLISLLQLLLSVNLGWLPSSGWGEPKHLVMPVIVLSFGTIATYARYVKASMLETMDQDYVLTARAKGLSERQVITRHVLRNSLMPCVTIFAGSVVGVFTGAFVTERMFAIPGIGFYYINSINSHDYTMVLGTTVFYAALFIIMQVVLDFVYMLIDPRIRITGKR